MGCRWHKVIWSALLPLWLLTTLPGREGITAVGGAGRISLPEPPPVVALTFDDGPRPDTTARLLEELALREIPATFFLVGEQLPGNEALLRQMAREGHQVGVHSSTHRRLTELSPQDFAREVEDTRTRLRALLGEGDYWLRPPYGLVDQGVILRAGSPIILWSLDSLDWKDRTPSRIVSDVTEQVQDGDIILFHDIYPTTVDAVAQIADILMQRGYCFVTVEQLLQLREITPKDGGIYRSAPPAHSAESG